MLSNKNSFRPSQKQNKSIVRLYLYEGFLLLRKHNKQHIFAITTNNKICI